MYTRYFRRKNPKCRPEEIEWIEMSGKEFYRFVNSSEGQGRYFIDMGDVVLEASKREAQIHRAEKDHSDYLKEQEEGWSTLSIYADEYGYSGEEIIADEAHDVEAEAIMRIETAALQKALTRLVHIPDQTCQLHGEFPPGGRRKPATPPEGSASNGLCQP